MFGYIFGKTLEEMKKEFSGKWKVLIADSFEDVAAQQSWRSRLPDYFVSLKTLLTQFVLGRRYYIVGKGIYNAFKAPAVPEE